MHVRGPCRLPGRQNQEFHADEADDADSHGSDPRKSASSASSACNSFLVSLRSDAWQPRKVGHGSWRRVGIVEGGAWAAGRSVASLSTRMALGGCPNGIDLLQSVFGSLAD